MLPQISIPVTGPLYFDLPAKPPYPGTLLLGIAFVLSNISAPQLYASNFAGLCSAFSQVTWYTPAPSVFLKLHIHCPLLSTLLSIANPKVYSQVPTYRVQLSSNSYSQK